MSNPVLTEQTFDTQTQAYAGSTTMTVQGTIVKTGVLLSICVATAAFAWNRFLIGGMDVAIPLMLGGVLVGFALALVISFVPHTAPYISPVYAAAEGLFLGAVSAMFEKRYPGIAVQGIGMTLATAGAMLGAYQVGLIKANSFIMRMVNMMVMGLVLFYLAAFLLSFAGIGVPYIHSSGPIGIAFSVFVAGLAAFSLINDYDFIETRAAMGAPKYMEWYGAFGLMVTLVWLYLEILKLLAKLQDRR